MGAPDTKKYQAGTGDHIVQFLKGRLGDFVGCQVCWWGVGELHDLVSNSLIVNIIEDSGILACSAFLDWSTCSGFVNKFAPMIVSNLLELNLQ